MLCELSFFGLHTIVKITALGLKMVIVLLFLSVLFPNDIAEGDINRC